MSTNHSVQIPFSQIYSVQNQGFSQSLTGIMTWENVTLPSTPAPTVSVITPNPVVRLPSGITDQNDQIVINSVTASSSQVVVAFTVNFDQSMPLNDTNAVIVNLQVNLTNSFANISSNIALFPTIVTLDLNNTPSVTITSPDSAISGSAESATSSVAYPPGSSITWNLAPTTRPGVIVVPGSFSFSQNGADCSHQHHSSPHRGLGHDQDHDRYSANRLVFADFLLDCLDQITLHIPARIVRESVRGGGRPPLVGSNYSSG